MEEGGNALSVEKEDLKQICDEGPNIIVLMIGENNIFLDTDPKGLAGRIVSLATMMCNKGYTEEVVICKLLPHLCAPQCIFGAAQPAWSVLQSDCVMADQPKKFSTRVTYVIKLSKAYKASSNVLKEIVKLTKE